MGATLFDKIWSRHSIAEDEGGKTLLYVDRVVVDDGRAPQVLKNLERRGLAIRRPASNPSPIRSTMASPRWRSIVTSG